MDLQIEQSRSSQTMPEEEPHAVEPARMEALLHGLAMRHLQQALSGKLTHPGLYGSVTGKIVALASERKLDPAITQRLLERGLTPAQIAETHEAERTALLGGDDAHGKLVHDLLDAGMSVHDVATYAGTVVTAREATPEFLTRLSERLRQPDTSGEAAIAGARYGDQIQAKELADPTFLHDLLYAGDAWKGPEGSQQALALLKSLAYARDHVDIFEAAEKVAVPKSHADNKWFANAGVDQLASMKTDDKAWASIERTLGRNLKMDERQAAIDAAKGLTDNWGTLCKMAKDIGLPVREDTTDVIDFTQEDLNKLNTSPLVAKLNNGPSMFGLTDMNIISALDYTRNHIDLFEAAEKVADPDSHADNRWFANAGVYQLAGMKTDDKAWDQIELTLGHKLSTSERQDAAKAAKALTENWDTLCSHAEEIGLELRKGTTDVLDFRGGRAIAISSSLHAKHNLRNLNFTPLVPLVQGGPTTADALKYARARQLERTLSTDGQAPAGADRDALLERPLDELNRLNQLDPAGVKLLLKERPLNEIAQLAPEQLKALSQIDPDLLSWLLKPPSHTLGEVAKLTTRELEALRNAMVQDYRQASAEEEFDDILPESISAPISLDSGTLTFQTTSGDKIIVTKESNTDLHNKVHDMLQARAPGQIDAIREEFGLPPSADVDVMNLPGDSGQMSISQRTITSVLDKYREMIKKGEITHDDPRAQFVRATEAASALSNGHSLLPYYEAPQIFGGTSRTYPGSESKPKMQEMSPEDVEAILDEGKVSQRINELLEDPTIQADYQSALNNATSTLPKQELIDKLYNSLTSEAYTRAIKALKDKGLSPEAEQMLQRDLASLAMLDPAKAAEAGQKLSINSLGADLQMLIDDPSLIDDETFAQATTDSMDIAIQALRSSSSIARHGTQTKSEYMIDYLEGFKQDKKSVDALADTIKQLVIDAKQGKTVDLANISQAQFDEAMAKTYVPLELRGKVSGFFSTTQKYGMWGTLGGGAALTSFGYKVFHGGAWGADSTAMERWGAARDIISFLSVAGHVAKFGAGIVDFLHSDPNSQMAWKALGLDRSLPEVWGKKSFLGTSSPPDAPNTSRIDNELAQALSDGFDDMHNTYDRASDRSLSSITSEDRQRVQSAVDNLDEIYKQADPETLTKLGSLRQRIAVTTLKVVGTVTDLAGIADVVLGVMNLVNGTGDKASNILSIGGGLALTGGGIIGTAQLVAPVSQGVAALAAPLFLTGALLSASAFMVSAFVQSTKQHNRLQDASDDQGKWFKDLADDGLARTDWADRLEFLRYAFAIYGNDNPDTSKSYFEYQKAEWEHFHNTPGKHGSSLNRLSRDLHIVNDKTWGSDTVEDVYV